MGLVARQAFADCSSSQAPAWRAAAQDLQVALLRLLARFTRNQRKLMQCFLTISCFKLVKSYFAQAAGVNRPCQTCWPGLRRGFAAQAGPAPASPASSPSKRGVNNHLVCQEMLCMHVQAFSACCLPSSGPQPALVRASFNCVQDYNIYCLDTEALLKQCPILNLQYSLPSPILCLEQSSGEAQCSLLTCTRGRLLSSVP